MSAPSKRREVLREAFTGLNGPPAGAKRLLIGAKLYLFIALPFVLVPTGLNHISQAADAWQPAVAWRLVWLWWACAALILIANVVVLLLRGHGRMSRWLSLATFVALLGTNQMTMMGFGSLTSWTTLYIILLVACYRVLADYELALTGTVAGAVLLVVGVVAELSNLIPVAALAPTPISHPLYDDTALAVSTLVITVLSILITFFLVNYGMNQSLKLHRYITHTVLQRYLPPALVKRASEGELRLDEPPERRVVTVLFTDLVGFTAFSERLGPDAVATYLNTYLSAMANLAHEHGATVDKFVGDAVMIVYGAPEPMPPEEQAERTVGLALAMIALTANLPGERLQLRTGINTGEAVVGNFGSEHRSDYTVIGPLVNVAARLESACAPGRVLIGPGTAALLPKAPLESVGMLELKGVSEAIEAWYYNSVADPE